MWCSILLLMFFGGCLGQSSSGIVFTGQTSRKLQKRYFLFDKIFPYLNHYPTLFHVATTARPNAPQQANCQCVPAGTCNFGAPGIDIRIVNQVFLFYFYTQILCNKINFQCNCFFFIHRVNKVVHLVKSGVVVPRKIFKLAVVSEK